MKLWYSPPSPFARKARIAALELGLAERVEQIEVAVAPHKPNEELGRRNPLMKVPALETDDGFVLFDSRVICEYLDAQAGGDRLIPAAPDKRWTVLRRQALGDGVTDAGILRRYELAARPRRCAGPTGSRGSRRRSTSGSTSPSARRRTGEVARHRPDRDRVRAALARLPLSRRRLAPRPARARGMARRDRPAAVVRADDAARLSTGPFRQARRRARRRR